MIRKMYLCVVDGRSIDEQYSKWSGDNPSSSDDKCVLVTRFNEWLPYSCATSQKYVCQS